MTEINPIAKATFLGFLMMARSPVVLNLKTISANLDIPLDQLTAILHELEAEGRLQLTLTQAIAHRLNPPESASEPTESPEAKDEGWQPIIDAKAAKKGDKNNAPT